MIAALCSNGQIELGELSTDCRKDKWIPIAILRDKNDSVIVPTFVHETIVKKFCKRNFPKNWVIGAVLLSDNDLAFIRNKGWKIMILDYPKLFTSHPDYKLDFEIIEFADEPNLTYS